MHSSTPILADLFHITIAHSEDKYLLFFKILQTVYYTDYQKNKKKKITLEKLVPPDNTFFL